MLKRTLAFVAALGMSISAHAVTINFDEDLAGFTAPAASSGIAGAVIVDDQFASVGVLFRDMDFPTLGVWVGNPNGPFVSSPNVLYSNNGNGGFDYLVKVELTFVDPADINSAATVESISGVWTDAGAGSTLTAYDSNNAVLGVATAVTGNQETLSLSGIGAISRVEFVAVDATGLDDIIFGDISAAESAALPVPTLADLGLLLLILSILMIAGRHLYQPARRT